LGVIDEISHTASLPVEPGMRQRSVCWLGKFLKCLKRCSIGKVLLLASYLLILDPATRLVSVAETAAICPGILTTEGLMIELFGKATSLAILLAAYQASRVSLRD
jgi:hypothetical protein